MIINNRDYKECLKDFVKGLNSELGRPEDIDTNKETMFVRTMLYTIPAYVDTFLKEGPSNWGRLEVLITSKDVFTLRAMVGFVSVLIEYNLEDGESAYGCTFTNTLTSESLFMQTINGWFYADTNRDIQQKIYSIFD